jgi:hypothetical protein
MRADRGLDPAQDRDADGLHEQRAAAYPVDLVGPVAVPSLEIEGPRGLVAGLIQGPEPARKLVAVEEESVRVVHEELGHLLDRGVVRRVAPGCGRVELLEALEVGADPVEVAARGAGGYDLLRRSLQLLLEGGSLGRDDHHIELVLLEDLPARRSLTPKRIREWPRSTRRLSPRRGRVTYRERGGSLASFQVNTTPCKAICNEPDGA